MTDFHWKYNNTVEKLQINHEYQNFIPGTRTLSQIQCLYEFQFHKLFTSSYKWSFIVIYIMQTLIPSDIFC